MLSKACRLKGDHMLSPSEDKLLLKTGSLWDRSAEGNSFNGNQPISDGGVNRFHLSFRKESEHRKTNLAQFLRLFATSARYESKCLKSRSHVASGIYDRRNFRDRRMWSFAGGSSDGFAVG